MKNLSLVVLLGMLGACKGAGSWEGIWMVQQPLTEAADCLPDVDENYKDASVPDELELEDSPWEYTDKEKVSDAVFFVQVLEQGGEVFVFVDDVPYFGTADGKTLTAEWTDSADTEDVAEHEEGYIYETTNNLQSTTALSFTRGEKGVVTGTIEYKLKSTATYTESDDWAPSDVGFNSGQMNGVVSSWLENDDPGGTQNAAGDDDCDGDECELQIRYDCKDSVDVQVFFAGDHDEGMYESAKEATHDFGGGGGGGTYYTY